MLSSYTDALTAAAGGATRLPLLPFDMSEHGTMHIGTWWSSDGRMRVRLDADGGFHEMRTDRVETHHGVYTIDGSRIRFRDPASGYETVGEFRDDVMYADGWQFRKSEDDAPP